ncbi:hypothetical protein BKE38_11090 [Pseudoroseomonas deserti]|uniref:Glycosyltransferase 2-like domain-containing protein n=1 Tax=Teichococcus deserti TaxID=1817963 RepID=A0A1V2H372_9PROT|nr:glycosyltransferase [Pseudoroseomonas deserti]ONG54013.1 hypothetical protein BKE38_11090 [Pseudoroseomonas deserti]
MAEPEISVVVISHDMARELPRTVLSLSPGYQVDCPPGRCEVIVVDNGSAVSPQQEDLAAPGLTLSLHHQPQAGPSPVAAINLGLSLARGALVGVCIDGARLASPGLLAACARAARLHPRPVLATVNYHLGPAEQYLSMLDGYDQAEEDRLLASIDWPRGAARLREIATEVWHGGRDGPMLESNALFMPRALWDELGGYDARFVGPGGGGANIDMLHRACAAPGTQLIRIADEGTFHQLHGGALSNAPNRGMEAGKRLSAEYYRITGRPIRPIKDRGLLFEAGSGKLRQESGHG